MTSQVGVSAPLVDTLITATPGGKKGGFEDGSLNPLLKGLIMSWRKIDNLKIIPSMF